MRSTLSGFMARLAEKKADELYEENQKKNIGVLKMPASFFWFGLAGMVVFGVLLIVVAPVADDNGLSYGLFGFLFVSGLLIAVIQKNCLALYRDNEIIYRNILRITRKYDCREIDCAYYSDGGGILFVFQDGRKLRFDKDERVFYRDIVKREQVKCRFRGDEKPVIKAGYHPLLLGFFWVLILSMIVLVLQRPDRDMILTIMIMALIFLGFQLSTTSYDKERKILTRRIYGFPFKYDMSRCKAKAVYEGDLVKGIAIYKNGRKRVKIPVGTEYRNSAALAYALCGVYVYRQWR